MRTSELPHDRVREAVAGARSLSGVVRALGFNSSGGRRRTVARLVADLDIDTSHFGPCGWVKYSPAALGEAVAASTSIAEVMDRLGVPRLGGAHAHISRRIKSLGLDTSHFRTDPSVPALRLPDDDRLREAAAGARSFAEVLRRLDLPSRRADLRVKLRERIRELRLDEPCGWQRIEIDPAAAATAVSEATCLSDAIRALGLDVTESNRRRLLRCVERHAIATDHLRRAPTRKPPAPSTARRVMLAPRAPDTPRVKGSLLRRAMIERGVELVCAECGLPPMWRGRPIVLEVDHVNGDPWDNRLENLRFLCPNCHSQTATYAGRNKSQKQAALKARAPATAVRAGGLEPPRCEPLESKSSASTCSATPACEAV